MPYRSLKQVLLAKPEVTYGVDAVPTGVLNAMLVSNVKLNPLNATEIDRKVLQGFFANMGKIVVGEHVTLDFDVEIAASGVAGTAPAWGTLMKGCALAETIVAATSVTYTPVSVGEQSLTLYLNIDGKQRIVKGARGNVKAKLSAKGDPLWSFSFIGVYAAPTDTALPAATLSAFKAPLGVSATNTVATVHGFAAAISDFSLDMGNKMVFRSLINSAAVVFTDRSTTGAITLEDVPVLTKAFDAIALAQTTGIVQLTHGILAGQKVQINAPAVQLHALQYSEQDNIEMLQMNMAMLPVVGNDEISIVCL